MDAHRRTQNRVQSVVISPAGLVLCWGLVVALGAAEVCASGLDVNSWDLTTGISDIEGQTFHAFITPMNPFVNFDGVMRGASVAQSTYNVHFAQQFLDFKIFSDLHCQSSGLSPDCSSSGDVFITTTADFMVNVTAAVNYTFSTDRMGAGIGFVILDMSTGNPHTVFGRSDAADALLDPWTGQLTLNDSFLLPGGGPYLFRYSVNTDAPPPSGSVVTMQGQLRYTLTAVPEPSGLMALSAAALVVVRRRSPHAPTPSRAVTSFPRRSSPSPSAPARGRCPNRPGFAG